MRKKCIYSIGIIVIFCFSLYLICFNFKNNPSFFCASFTQLLTLLITVFIAFWATQFKNDERKQKDHAEDILTIIQESVSEESFIKITTDTDTKLITMNNRKLSNKISVLIQYSNKLNFKQDAKYIEEKFKEYQEFVSNHINDLEYLSKSSAELIKYANLIESKCDTIFYKVRNNGRTFERS